MLGVTLHDLEEKAMLFGGIGFVEEGGKEGGGRGTEEVLIKSKYIINVDHAVLFKKIVVLREELPENIVGWVGSMRDFDKGDECAGGMIFNKGGKEIFKAV